MNSEQRQAIQMVAHFTSQYAASWGGHNPTDIEFQQGLVELMKSSKIAYDAVGDKSLEEVMADVVAWQNFQFPDSNPKSIAAHLLEEAHELYDDPTNAEEMADVMMLLTGLCARTGVNLTEVLARKLKINKARSWEQPQANGVINHVREQASPEVAPDPPSNR